MRAERNNFWSNQTDKADRRYSNYKCLKWRAESGVRRIKTYLTSTLSQQRLTHCMILHIDKKLTGSLFLHWSANDFVFNANRKKFWDTNWKDLLVYSNKK